MKLFFIFLLLLLYKDCFFPEESQYRCERKMMPGMIIVVHYLNPVFLRSEQVCFQRGDAAFTCFLGAAGCV